MGMCPCEEMGRCDNHEGVGIRVGDKTYLCGEMQVGTDAMRVRGIHVGGSRWNPCENMQVGMDVMSTRGHMAMQVGQGASMQEHAGQQQVGILGCGWDVCCPWWGEYGEMLLHNLPTQVSTL